MPLVEEGIALHSPGGLAFVTSRGAFQLHRHQLFLTNQLRKAARDAEAGLLDGLTISCPPQHGKSQLCSRYLPAWYLGTYPDRRVILTSYEAEFAAGWSRQARDLLTQFGSIYGVGVARGAASASNWEMATHGGGMSSAGAGGPITGKSASLLVIDDPVKNDTQARSARFREHQWDWWQSVASTRLSPRGLVVVIQTRWHRDDLTGRLQAWVNREGQALRWRNLSLPAIAEPDDAMGRQAGEALWPERYSLEELQRMRAGKTPYYWRALYQQDPQAEGGTEFPASWFEGKDLWFEEWPTASRCRVVALDPALGAHASYGDYSAFVMLLVDAEGRLWVDADLRRSHVVEIVETAIEIQRKFTAERFAVEANQFQELIADQIWRESKARGLITPALGLKNGPLTSKLQRIRRLSPFLSRREIRFKANSPGAKLLFDQLRDFPTAEHDDGPDALEMALRTAILHLQGTDLDDGRTCERILPV